MNNVLAAVAAAVTLLAAPVPGAASEPIRVSGLTRGGTPVAEAAEVRLWRLAQAGVGVALRSGAELTTGDLLAGDGAGVTVELSCAAGSRLLVAGGFRLEIETSKAAGGCAVELLAGRIEISGSGTTEVRSGTLAASADGGRWAVVLEAREGSAAAPVRQQVSVLDGSVSVLTPAGSARVSAGRALTVETPAGRPAAATLAEGPLPDEGEAPAAMAEAAPPAPAAPVADASPAPAAAGAAGETAMPSAAREAPVAPSAPAPAPVVEAAPDRSELRSLIEQRRHQEVVDALEPRVAGDTLSSVDYFLLAQAYQGLGRTERAASYARRALRLDEIDDQLTTRELAQAQNLRAGGDRDR